MSLPFNSSRTAVAVEYEIVSICFPLRIQRDCITHYKLSAYDDIRRNLLAAFRLSEPADK